MGIGLMPVAQAIVNRLLECHANLYISTITWLATHTVGWMRSNSSGWQMELAINVKHVHVRE